MLSKRLADMDREYRQLRHGIFLEAAISTEKLEQLELAKRRQAMLDREQATAARIEDLEKELERLQLSSRSLQLEATPGPALSEDKCGALQIAPPVADAQGGKEGPAKKEVPVQRKVLPLCFQQPMPCLDLMWIMTKYPHIST